MYTLNNLQFRIVSSHALCTFKKCQAFALNEIQNGKFNFQKDSKETLLLNYEVQFRFLLNIEKIFIKNNKKDKVVGKDLMNFIRILISENNDEIQDIMSANLDIFSTSVRTVTVKTHSIYIEYLFKKIQELSKETIYTAYPKIVLVVTDILEELLYELHELETLRENCQTLSDVKTNEPFISFTKTSYDVYNNLKICPLNYRLGIYKTAFGFEEFYVKNYTKQKLNKKMLNLIQNNETQIIKVLDSTVTV